MANSIYGSPCTSVAPSDADVIELSSDSENEAVRSRSSIGLLAQALKELKRQQTINQETRRYVLPVTPRRSRMASHGLPQRETGYSKPEMGDFPTERRASDEGALFERSLRQRGRIGS